MAVRYFRAWLSELLWKAMRSPRLRAWQWEPNFIRCSRPLPNSAPLSADTARLESSSLQKRCSKTLPTLHEMKSRRPSPGTSAAARATSKYWKRWSWPLRVSAARRRNLPGRRFMAGNNGKRRNDLRVVGKPFIKVDAKAKCIGELKYADDLVLPRMLHTKLLRSTVPHARILNIDVSKAKAYPGVHAVLLGTDMPTPYGALPVSEDEHPLAIGKVRMVGDPVAAVAAVDEDVATDALHLIHVEYEPLPVVTSIDDAYVMAEPRIHEYGELGNIHRRQVYEFGSVDAGFAEADYVREDITFYEGSTHLALEQHASLAQFSRDG